MQLLMCSDDTRNTVSADAAPVSAAQPVVVSNTSNTATMPSYQYDTSAMTELSLTNDEVLCTIVRPYVRSNNKIRILYAFYDEKYHTRIIY